MKLLKHVLIPVKESVKAPGMKVNILLQAYIPQLKLDGSNFIFWTLPLDSNHALFRFHSCR